MPIMEDKFVINIGRQLGSGGKAVGEAIAQRLGIGVYDKQLINLAAEQSGLCPEVFERVDEKESRNLFSTLVAYLRSPFVGSEYAGSNVLSNDALFKIQSDVIRDIAARESCVFVGRCADYILSGSAASAALRPGRPRPGWIGRMRGARRTTTITAAVRGAWLRPTTSASIRPCWGSTARWISCWSSWSANWV